MVLVIAALAALAARRGSTPGPRPPAAAGSQRIAAEAAARSLAVTWVTGQVGRDVIVACDAVTCSDLAQHKFPAGNLTVLQATTPDPYGSSLVIATADIRSQFGSKLSSVYAPEVIASFGSGSDRIDIRVIAAGGPAEFQAALSKDLAVRKSSGAPLLRTNRIALSPSARTEIAAGHVDMRLITTIAFLAAMHPVDVVGFAGAARGADPDVPLRIAYLAQADASARLNTAAYVRALTDLVHAQQPPYVAQSVRTVRLPDGQAVLEIEFAAPSPLGLP